MKKIVLKTGEVVEIRLPKISDSKKLLDFINDLSAEKTFILSQGKKFTLKEEKKYLKSNIDGMNKSNYVLLFAIHNGKIIGNTGIHRHRSDAEKHLASFDIALSKDIRGKGLGNIMMKEIHSLAKKKIKGIKIFLLDVFANNDRAKDLYNSFGYKEYGLLPKGLLHKGKYIDNIAMYKKNV